MKKLKHLKTFEYHSTREDNEFAQIISLLETEMDDNFIYNQFYTNGAYVTDLIFDAGREDRNRISAQVDGAISDFGYDDEYETESFFRDGKLIVRIQDKID